MADGQRGGGTLWRARIGSNLRALGRETKSEVVLLTRLKAALFRLNPALRPEVITAADGLTRDRSAMSLEAACREVYR